MENQNPGFPGEFGRNSTEREEEQRFGEEAHAYTRGRDEQVRNDRLGRGEAWLPEEPRSLVGDDTLLDSENKTDRLSEQGGMATSSALVGTGTTSGVGSAYGSPIEGTQQDGGIGPVPRNIVGTAGAGSGTGPSSGGSSGGPTGAGTTDDAGWQRDRSAFQEHFAARHPPQGADTAARTWDQAEPNYRYGYEAASSERYQGHRFDAIEPDLRRDYERQARSSGNEQTSGWEHLREEVREGFNRFRAS